MALNNALSTGFKQFSAILTDPQILQPATAIHTFCTTNPIFQLVIFSAVITASCNSAQSTYKTGKSLLLFYIFLVLGSLGSGRILLSLALNSPVSMVQVPYVLLVTFLNLIAGH